jgi:hypothetical protein
MMENNKKIVFTDSANMRLEKLHMDLNAQIEQYLRDRKNVPGDDFIEVTASDIDELSYRIRIIRPSRANMKQVILYIYAIIGIITTIVGLFFNQIKNILFEDKERLIIITVGLTFSLAALLAAFMNKTKEKKEQELIDYERRKRKMDDFYDVHK